MGRGHVFACTCDRFSSAQQPLQLHRNQLAAELDGEGDGVALGSADGEALGQTGDTSSCTRLTPALAHTGGQAGGGSSCKDSTLAKAPSPTIEARAARQDSGLVAFVDTRRVM